MTDPKTISAALNHQLNDWQDEQPRALIKDGKLPAGAKIMARVDGTPHELVSKSGHKYVRVDLTVMGVGGQTPDWLSLEDKNGQVHPAQPQQPAWLSLKGSLWKQWNKLRPWTGCFIAIERKSESRSFTNDQGEAVTFHPLALTAVTAEGQSLDEAETRVDYPMPDQPPRFGAGSGDTSGRSGFPQRAGALPPAPETMVLDDDGEWGF